MDEDTHAAVGEMIEIMADLAILSGAGEAMRLRLRLRDRRGPVGTALLEILTQALAEGRLLQDPPQGAAE